MDLTYYIIYYRGIGHPKNKFLSKKKTAKIAKGYNTDSASLARIPVHLEMIILETIEKGLPPNGTVSKCLGT